MGMDRNMKMWLTAYLVLVMLAGVGCAIILHEAVQEVDKVGLKGIVERVWNGNK